jgi:hypothetical protein
MLLPEQSNDLSDETLGLTYFPRIPKHPAARKTLEIGWFWAENLLSLADQNRGHSYLSAS